MKEKSKKDLVKKALSVMQSDTRKDVLDWFENIFSLDVNETTTVEKIDDGKAKISFSVINKTKYSFSSFSYKAVFKNKENNQEIGASLIKVGNWNVGERKNFHTTISLGTVKSITIIMYANTVKYEIREMDISDSSAALTESERVTNDEYHAETQFVINKCITKTETGLQWMDDSIGCTLGLIDLLAKWSYEAENNYEKLPIPLGKLNVSPSIPPVNSLTDYGYDVWVGVNEFYDDAVNKWSGYKSNVSDKFFDPYYKHCSQYVQDYFDDLGVFEATNGLCPYWSNSSAVLGWYKTPVYQCQSTADFRKFMIEFDKLLKKRYPQNTISVQIPEETSSGGCYIATSVYGSYDCPEVWILRRFRDQCLSKSLSGRTFINIYYAISPKAVKLFGKTSWFKNGGRLILDIIVAKLNKKGYDDAPYHD